VSNYVSAILCLFLIGWFGFSLTIGTIVGGLAIGALADLPRFQRSLKLLLLINLSISFVFCLLFQLSVNTLLWPDRPPLPSSDVSIGILLSLVGLFSGAASPLIFECLAEMMYPLPESLTASIYVQFFNIFALIFVAIAAGRYKLMNLLVLLVIGITIGMVACARVTYKRKDHDENAKTSANFSSEDTTNL
jgi:MFS family permease